MIIETMRFGQVDVAEGEILHFPDGLPGFVDKKTFALLPYQPGAPVSFLQSLTAPELTFLVIDPFDFFADYRLELSDDMVEKMQISDENPPLILTIVTVQPDQESMTANLLAPLVINQRDRIGRQFVLENTAYAVRHSIIFPDEAQAAKGEE